MEKNKMKLKEIKQKIEMQSTKDLIELQKWLYKNHKKVLREYEKTKGNLRINFVGESK